MSLLEIDNLSKAFDGPNGVIQAVDGVTLTVDAGEFVAIRGPSGCGKTTLLLAAGGLLAPDGGEVCIAGEDPYRLTQEQRARFRAEHIGFVFQQFHLIPYLSVLENIRVPELATGRADCRARAASLAVQFGLGDRLDHLPSQLSTGERQRTALARALLNKPGLLLADEPTGNLDDANACSVLDALSDFARSGGAVLLVTHDPKAAEHAVRCVEWGMAK